MTADFLPYPMEFLARTATRIEELEGRDALLAVGTPLQWVAVDNPTLGSQQGQCADRR